MMDLLIYVILQKVLNKKYLFIFERFANVFETVPKRSNFVYFHKM